jgi:nitrogen regulatory protein PII-like uncharacterized protein
MPSNYQVFHRKQDIGKRISQLHREEQLAVGIVATGSVDELTDAVSACVNAVRWPVSVIMYEEMGRVVELRSMFPQVTFIVFQNPVTMGTKLNAMADECYTTYFFIIRSDQRILAFNDEELFALLRRSDRPAAVVPTLVNRNGEPMPSIQAPMVREGMVDPMPFFPSTAIVPTLYPFFGVGMYDRALFQRLRGFDENIVSDYWQFLDFGARCWLYGYPIFCHPRFAMAFTSRQAIIEDRSNQPGMERCTTKALGVRQINGKNYTRKYSRNTDVRLLRTEVKKRLALYKTDFFQLMADWKAPEASG